MTPDPDPVGLSAPADDLFAAVTELDDPEDPGPDAEAQAAALDAAGQPDMRGTRDLDLDAPHPWRSGA